LEDDVSYLLKTDDDNQYFQQYNAACDKYGWTAVDQELQNQQQHLFHSEPDDDDVVFLGTSTYPVNYVDEVEYLDTIPALAIDVNQYHEPAEYEFDPMCPSMESEESECDTSFHPTPSRFSPRVARSYQHMLEQSRCNTPAVVSTPITEDTPDLEQLSDDEEYEYPVKRLRRCEPTNRIKIQSGKDMFYYLSESEVEEISKPEYNPRPEWVPSVNQHQNVIGSGSYVMDLVRGVMDLDSYYEDQRVMGMFDDMGATEDSISEISFLD
jgi:hypothetical protein